MANDHGGARTGAGRKRHGLLTKAALKKQVEAVVIELALAGDINAIKFILPQQKPVTPEGSIDYEYLRAKIFEIHELEQRLIALEAASNDK